MNAWTRQHWEHRDKSNISGAGSCGPPTTVRQHQWDQLGSPGAGPSNGVIYNDRRTQPRERNPPMGTPGRLPFTYPDPEVVLTPRSRTGAGGFGPTRSPGTSSPSPRGAPPSPRMH